MDERFGRRGFLKRAFATAAAAGVALAVKDRLAAESPQVLKGEVGVVEAASVENVSLAPPRVLPYPAPGQTITGNAGSGTFTLDLGHGPTPPIPHDAPASHLHALLSPLGAPSFPPYEGAWAIGRDHDRLGWWHTYTIK